MEELLQLYLIVCPLIFLGGFVDSVAGGGGLITLPAYLMAGLPTHMAMGTNKVVNAIGTGTAALRYLKSGRVQLRVALVAAVTALVGSVIGTRVALLIPEDILKILMLVALPVVAGVLAGKKDFGKGSPGPKRSYSRRYEAAAAGIIGLVIGCYDGLVGPGTGTFMIMAFTMALSMDLITASGCAKIGNLASNVASAVVFLLNGKVFWALAVPAALCNALGGYCGARYAIRGGSGKIRGMIFLVLGLMFVKMLWDLLA